MNKFLTSAVAGPVILAVVCANELSHGQAGETLAKTGPGQTSPPKAQSAAPAKAPNRCGALVLVGGGSLPASIRRRFVELAGGAQASLVIIPSASASPEAPARSFAFWKTAPVKSVRILHTTRRSEADDPHVYGLLRQATGVWMSGGDQSRLTALYGGTRVERELANVLRRGGVIGGTSAGASVVSAVMVTAGGKAGKGFGLIADTIVDQHFSNRGRRSRLVGLLQSHPGQRGLGIDEQTAVVIRDQEVSVLGNATVTVAEPGSARPSVKVYHAGSHFCWPAPMHVVSR
jgi:cyanophycinase